MTNSELAILSLIVEKSRHGYEIEQIIDQRGMREWTEIGFSSIYYLLKKLEKSGWLTSQLNHDNEQGPARKVYSVTAAGTAAWQQAVIDILSTPQQVSYPFQLGLANLPAIPADEAILALSRYRDQLADRRRSLEARWQHTDTAEAQHVDAMFDLSLTLINAELGWIEGFIQQLKQKGS